MKVKEAIDILREATSSLLRAGALIVQVRDGAKREPIRFDLDAARGVITVLEYFLRSTIRDLEKLEIMGVEEV